MKKDNIRFWCFISFLVIWFTTLVVISFKIHNDKQSTSFAKEIEALESVTDDIIYIRSKEGIMYAYTKTMQDSGHSITVMTVIPQSEVTKIPQYKIRNSGR